jgi:hypothetical protein
VKYYMSSTKNNLEYIYELEFVHYLKAKINFKNVFSNFHRLQIYCKVRANSLM